MFPRLGEQHIIYEWGIAMYTYQDAVVRERGTAARWIQANVGDVFIRSLAESYQGVYLILSHPSVDHKLGLNLADVASLLSAIRPDITVKQWLVSLGNASLPTSAQVPTISAKVAKYSDIFDAGYDVELAPEVMAADTPLTEADLKDLRVTKHDVDYKLLFDSCLVTVNGLLHRTDFDTQSFVVRKGGESVVRSNLNQVGLISFRDIGKVTQLPITEEMIYNPDPYTTLAQAVYLTLPEGVDLSTQSVMLSIAGHLHVLGAGYQVVGPREIKLDTARLPLAERYYAARKLINLDSVDKTLSLNNDKFGTVGYTDFYDDATVKAFLTLPQSFVILVDSPRLYVERHKLEYTGIPGRYLAREQPKYPLFLNDGRLPEYVAVPETGLWSIAVQDNFTTRYAFTKRDNRVEGAFNGARDSVFPVYYAHGFFLEIGADVVTV